jgi:glycosyltransferase involved in cell wall biosynthesis
MRDPREPLLRAAAINRPGMSLKAVEEGEIDTRVSEPKALVSICIPVYNGRRLLRETIESVRKQTYENIEILVQDNCSTDGTWELLESLAQEDSRISIQRNAFNAGMARNWNLVLKRARGEFLLLLSADDLLFPDFVERSIGQLVTSKADIVTANHLLILDSGERRRRVFISEGSYRGFSSLVLAANPFSINFTIFPRRTYELLNRPRGLFREDIYTCDYDLWFRVDSKKLSVFYQATPLGKYRVHEGNLSRNVRKMQRQTALVLLARQHVLGANHSLAFKATMVRFILRVLYRGAQAGTVDRRLLRVLTSRVVGRRS